MNKFINILLLLLTFPALAYTLVVGFDFPLEFLKISGANLPYKTVTFGAFAGVIFIVGARRSLRRWMGVKMINQLNRFQWNKPMAEKRYKQGIMYLVLEASTHFAVALAMFLVSDLSWMIVLVFIVLGIDHLIFAFVGKSKQLFRVGITSKAILVADRDLKAVYFSGLRKVDKHQQSLFFDYIKEFQVAFPVDCIDESHKEEFKAALEKNLDRDKVYFSESFKSF